MADALMVRSEVQIAAPPATVFAFLTDPERIMRWLGTDAKTETHPGGIYQVNVAGKHTARGEFTEVIPVHRLAYTFGWEERDNVPPGSTLIEIDLEDRDGGTLIRLAHSGLPNQHECDEHKKGWDHYMRRLSIAAAGGDPGPDGPGAAG